MKVLVSSISRDFGGVESLFLNLAQIARGQGLQFDFICTDSSAAREDDFISCGSKIFHIGRPSKQLVQYIKKFKRLFKSGQYDVYHVNLTRYRFPLDILIAKSCGVKVILHCHATQIYDVGSRKVRIIRNIEQKVFKPITLACSSLNIACSKNAGDYLFSPRQFQILYNGIDLARFQFNEESRMIIRNELDLEGKRVIGHIGRFSLEKNHIFLLKVLKELLALDQSYKLLCIGQGDLFDECIETSKNMGIADAVVFTGVRKDIPALLSAMDVFVFPSLHEALPITLIEAQVNGLTCVVSECVTKEIDKTNDIKRLSLEAEPYKWAAEINEICDERKGVNDFTTFADFSINNMIVRLVNFYENISNKNSRT